MIMAKFTKALRQQIIDTFLQTNNGWYDPALFVEWVRNQGAECPAYSWFEWDDEIAANKLRIEQARSFASGLRIKCEVEVIESGIGRSVTRESPMFVSPVDRRSQGGGYYRVDPKDPTHVAELGRQAAGHLKWFCDRFAVPLAAVGADMDALESLRSSLAAIREDKAA